MNSEALIFNIALSCEAMKAAGVIQDYCLEHEETNFSVAPNGDLHSELIITNKLIPKASAQWIDLDFTILPDGSDL